jgi:uncharacterized repeat protein (TIGR03847 family)
MRDLGAVESFRAGAVGEPGRRTFLLDVDGEHFLLEKEQVAALAARSLDLARTLGVQPQDPIAELNRAGEPTFRVGSIEITPEPHGITIVLHPVEGGDEEPVSFVVTPPAIDAMARRAVLVVAAGRLPCPYCNLPLDPAGHVCPASNGDRRRG